MNAKSAHETLFQRCVFDPWTLYQSYPIPANFTRYLSDVNTEVNMALTRTAIGPDKQVITGDRLELTNESHRDGPSMGLLLFGWRRRQRRRRGAGWRAAYRRRCRRRRNTTGIDPADLGRAVRI